MSICSISFKSFFSILPSPAEPPPPSLIFPTLQSLSNQWTVLSASIICSALSTQISNFLFDTKWHRGVALNHPCTRRYWFYEGKNHHENQYDIIFEKKMSTSKDMKILAAKTGSFLCNEIILHKNQWLKNSIENEFLPRENYLSKIFHFSGLLCRSRTNSRPSWPHSSSIESALLAKNQGWISA